MSLLKLYAMNQTNQLRAESQHYKLGDGGDQTKRQRYKTVYLKGYVTLKIEIKS